MSTLKERLEEVMAAMEWEHHDLVRVSRQSSSVVSQWLGKGSKLIKTIGKMEAAEAIEAASGFAALWVAKGTGPKRVPQITHLVSREPDPGYLTPTEILQHMRTLLAQVDPDLRTSFGDILYGWACDGGETDRSTALLALLAASGKRLNSG